MLTKVMSDYTSAMISQLHEEAQQCLDRAAANSSEANYIANMTAALVLKSLASAYMATRDAK